MHQTAIRLLLLVYAFLPSLVNAAEIPIHAVWNTYSPPQGYTLTGFQLYQDGAPACQTNDPAATSMDCTVSFTGESAAYSLAALFTGGIQSPHSTAFTFTATTDSNAGSEDGADNTDTDNGETINITAEWNSYTSPAGYTVSGFHLYQEGNSACTILNPQATSLSCQVAKGADTDTFTLTAMFTDGTESPHSAATTLSNNTDNSTGTGGTTNPTDGSDSTTNPNDTSDDSGNTDSSTSNNDTTTGDNTSSGSSNNSSDDTTENGTLIHAEWTPYATPEGYTVKGFNLYQEGSIACTTEETNATSMECEVTLTAEETSFTLTAYFTDGTESPHSSPFIYTQDNPINSATLTAAVETNVTTGQVPLTVEFNAAQSTGNIQQYSWNFGDGSVDAGDHTTHSYTVAGTYTVTLTVTDADGATSTATAAVTVTENGSLNQQPTAIISSSSAAGASPLTVTFDGSESTPVTNSSILSYSWSFGDGGSATGPITTHTFAEAGTYSCILQIIDANGQTNSASTPIVVTQGSTNNSSPKAIIAANPNEGTVPLTVTFDGSESRDDDGSITSYTWDFGDGNTGTGQTTSHTYLTQANFTATLTVTDNQGASNSASTSVVTTADQQATELNIETGEISVNHQWKRVAFAHAFSHPIVVAGPPTITEEHPCVVRLRNITTTGFEIRLEEWDYLNEVHAEEVVNYLVLENGRTTLPNGMIVEAGSFVGSSATKPIAFTDAFNTIPVVISTVASENGGDTVSGRIKNISTQSFRYYLKEQESYKNSHVPETIHYIAWEPGSGTIGASNFIVKTTPNAVTENWYKVAFAQTLQSIPLVIADMQTTDGIDASALRIKDISTESFSVQVQEEQSKDEELRHTSESVGYILITPTE